MTKTRIGLVLLTVLVVLGVGVRLGLPAVLRAAGVHPHHDLPSFDLSGKRALIVATSHGTLGERGDATGVFGSELTVPYYAFLDAGMEVDLASPQGGEIPVEPGSMGWPLATDADRRFTRDEAAMHKLRNSLRVADLDGGAYDVVFLAGGWGAAYDLGQSAEVGALMTEANARQAVIGGVCHGPLGLLQARDTDGSPLVEGRRLTAVTDVQVQQLGIELTPLHPETELRNAGALFESRTAFRDFLATHVVVDGNLVTGQNQNSGAETAHRMMDLLAAP
jgi:putative intracellular protease/amidase